MDKDIIDPDYKDSFDLAKRSAEKGNMWDQYCLGEMYFKGYGLAPNYLKAAKYFKLSAAQGCTIAQGKLDFLYEGDFGVSPRR